MTGTPTVSTSVGTEGLGLIPGEHGEGRRTPTPRVWRRPSRSFSSTTGPASGLPPRAPTVLEAPQPRRRARRRSSGRSAVAPCDRPTKRRKAVSRGRRSRFGERSHQPGNPAAARRDLRGAARPGARGAAVAVVNRGSTELLRLGPTLRVRYDPSGRRQTRRARSLDQLIAKGAEVRRCRPRSVKNGPRSRPLLRQHLDRLPHPASSSKPADLGHRLRAQAEADPDADTRLRRRDPGPRPRSSGGSPTRTALVGGAEPHQPQRARARPARA